MSWPRSFSWVDAKPNRVSAAQLIISSLQQEANSLEDHTQMGALGRLLPATGSPQSSNRVALFQQPGSHENGGRFNSQDSVAESYGLEPRIPRLLQFLRGPTSRGSDSADHPLAGGINHIRN